MHIPSEGCGMSKDKQAKILDLATTHQLIVLENPPPIIMEETKSKSSSNNDVVTPPSKSDSNNPNTVGNLGNFS